MISNRLNNNRMQNENGTKFHSQESSRGINRTSGLPGNTLSAVYNSMKLWIWTFRSKGNFILARSSDHDFEMIPDMSLICHREQARFSSFRINSPKINHFNLKSTIDWKLCSFWGFPQKDFKWVGLQWELKAGDSPKIRKNWSNRDFYSQLIIFYHFISWF